mgnify:CR=1 FL=1
MSKLEVNTIDTQCGSALQIGDGNTATIGLGKSGDTITVPSGATIVNNGTQTGFGRTGTVDWDTSNIKTATFSAANGSGYFCNTSGGAFTCNLPAGSAGAIVSVVDYTNTFQTHNLTVAPNGSEKIGGAAASTKLNTEGQSVTFVYVDANEGWKNVQDSTSNVVGSPYLVATGGTITCCGNYKIHTFTGPGTFTVSSAAPVGANNIVDYLVVGGGGAAPSTGGGDGISGGGGGGGFRYYANTTNNPQSGNPASPINNAGNSPNTEVTVTATGYPITVGAGMSIPSSGPGTGTPSIFSTVTSAGGGAGGRGDPAAGGYTGGSGGGSDNGGHTAAAGNTPPVSPPQGNDGGSSRPANGGGGGGAMAVGEQGPPTVGGNGGIGGGVTGFGTSGQPSGGKYYFSGGGGGGNGNANYPAAAGTGGTGGGANGKNPGCVSASNGTVNTGGGGGGASDKNPGGGAGGAGGSGIVVIRYRYQ